MESAAVLRALRVRPVSVDHLRVGAGVLLALDRPKAGVRYAPVPLAVLVLLHVVARVVPLVDGAASVEEALAGAVHKLREAVAEDAGPHARGRPEANGGILGRLLIVLGNVGAIACRMGGAKVVVLEARDLQRAAEVCVCQGGLQRQGAPLQTSSPVSGLCPSKAGSRPC